jgi:ribosome biogenesis protein BMS1
MSLMPDDCACPAHLKRSDKLPTLTISPPSFQVPLPRLHNPMTDLLAPAPKARALRGPRDRRAGPYPTPTDADAEDGGAAEQLPGPPDGGSDGEQEDGFETAARFAGARPGWVFKKGPSGVGYYRDDGSSAAVKRAAAEAAAAVASGSGRSGGGSGLAAAAGAAGWVGMRTVAELRREAGVGAPREPDSIYRPIERGTRVFNPLKVPNKLQAALPFKTKPKVVGADRGLRGRGALALLAALVTLAASLLTMLNALSTHPPPVLQEAPRKRKSLEQRRAVVLDKPEKRAAALLQQLNAIRNAKAEKRREVAARKRGEREKKVAKEEEWRGK